MNCQECNQRPATLHFTKVVNGEKEEFHLCEKCAQEKGELLLPNSSTGFSINNLLSGLFNIESYFQQKQQNPFEKQEILQCDQCTMTFHQFVKVGRFGCSNCYDAFKEQLNPILRRLHNGNSTHNGKIPARIGGNIHIKKNIEDLKLQLKNMIMNEEFEKAAELRDEIRSLEGKLSNSNGGGE